MNLAQDQSIYHISYDVLRVYPQSFSFSEHRPSLILFLANHHLDFMKTTRVFSLVKSTTFLFSRFKKLIHSTALAGGLLVASSAMGIQPVRVVTTLNSIFDTQEGRVGKTQSYTRWPLIVGSGNVSELILSANGWLIGSGYSVTSNSYTIVSMAIEKDGTTIHVPVTWAGSRSVTINPGDNDIQSDPISASAFGQSSLIRGERYWVRTVLSVAAAGNAIPLSGARAVSAVPGTQAAWFDPSVTTIVNGVDSTGSFTTSGTAVENRGGGFYPMVLGRFVSGDPVCMVAVGDSITAGFGDSKSPLNGFGMYQRALVDVDGTGNPVAGINLARGGAASSAYLNTTITSWAKYANNAYVNLGTNDLGVAGTGSVSALETNLQTIWNNIKAQGVQKIISGTLQPRTTSTDTWITVAGQTPTSAGWDTGGKSTQINTWLNAQVGSNLFAVMPFTNNRVSGDTIRWAVNGTAHYTTSDGTHPSPQGHIFGANEIRTAMAQLVTSGPEVNVTGNGLDIMNGDTTPGLSDRTDFGSVDVTVGSVTNTYTIQNTGSATLTIAVPVTISGSNAADFTVVTQPAASIAANGSTTFSVKFDPGAAGLRQAVLSFGNNDSNENPYSFSIQGTGTTVAAPAITSGSSAAGTVGSAFSYQITATNSPTSYGAAVLPGGLNINSATGLISGTPTAAGTSTISLSAVNASGTGTGTLVLTVSPSGGTLPSPWANKDIGSVGISGTSTYSGGTFTVSGEGIEILATGTTDAFQYAYQPASGDCDISARVATLSSPGDAIKGEGGVMIRNDLTAGAICATVGVTSGRGLNFTYRTTTSGTSVNVAGPGGTAPYWVRLIRSGSTFTGYVSTSGTSWTQVGTAQTINMGTNVYIGLPSTNHSSQLSTATCDNVTVAP